MTKSTKSAKNANASKPVARRRAAAKPAPATASAPKAKLVPTAKPAAVKRDSAKDKKSGKDKHKTKKLHTVRDSFNMPDADYALIGTLKKRALGRATEVKKSELLRAGLKALASMTDQAFLAALKSVEVVKTGRPATQQ